MAKSRTLDDKIWDDHLVDEQPDGTCLLYIDRHLVHEVTSPQAFEGLRTAGRKVHAPDKTLAVVDHNVPTSDRSKPNPDPESAEQIATLAQNAKDFGIEYFNEFDKRQGIVHIIGPEQGFTLPGTTIVCGDSHTATHGAFGALAYGIGTSEVEHVLATQTLIQTKSKNMRAVVDNKLPPASPPGHPRHHRGNRHRRRHQLRAGICRRGDLISRSDATICHVGGRRAKAGFVAPDQKAFDYLKGKPKAPKGKAWDEAMRYWETLRSDDGAHFDREIHLDAAKLPPIVTWGTSPEQVVSVTGRVPVPAEIQDEKKRIAAERSLGYMGLAGGEKITDIKLDRVFIGSCTNGRIEDLREVARRHDKKVSHVAMIVPGSGLVKEQAEAEPRQDFQPPASTGASPLLHVLAMNPTSSLGERCASTRTAPRRPPGVSAGRTHLRRRMAAAAAIAGTCRCAGGNSAMASFERKGPPTGAFFVFIIVKHVTGNA